MTQEEFKSNRDARDIINAARLQLATGWADRGSRLYRAREILSNAHDHLLRVMLARVQKEREG